MSLNTLPQPQEIEQAFAEYDRQVTISNFKVACILGFILMPAGVALDWFVYPDSVGFFLQLRLLCSVLIAVFFVLLQTPLGRRYYRFQGVTLFLLPSFFIALMIYASEGAASPYYAGLNLVFLVLGFVLHWTFRESLAAFGLVLLMYVTACRLSPAPVEPGIFFNNLYFLALTGVIVVTGSYFHSRLRYREFAARYELDAGRRILEETNQKLVELDRIKSQFFANISHELRTPLTLLLSPLDMLLHRPPVAFDADTRQLIHTMHANGLRLLKLINDLLDLVRLDSGRIRLKPEPLELATFLKGLGSAVRQVAQSKQLRLEVEAGPELGVLLADRDKLEKVLLNLLFNAIKFTPASGRVTLAAERRNGTLFLAVSDTGMGIAEKNLPFIFDRFWQADGSTSRRHHGVGIGLALVKEFTELQGGRVEVSSREGEGTTFTVQLPWQDVPAAGSPAPAGEGVAEAVRTTEPGSEEWLSQLYRRAELFPATAAVEAPAGVVEGPGDRQRPLIVVADDEADMLRFLHSQLQAHYQVVDAVDGRQAVAAVNRHLPDIVLIDMMMPELDGMGVCRALRDREETRNIPIVMLTARADEETKLAALSAGASDFLAKPFSTTELHVRLKNLLAAHRYQKALAERNDLLARTIDQLKQTESQLVQSEKLASLGRLSAGIIHEINNPLNFAATCLFSLKQKAGLLPPAEQAEYTEVLGDMQEGLDRVKHIVLDLRIFTHPGTGQVDEVPVIEAVRLALRFLSNELRNHVEMHVTLPDSVVVLADCNKLVHLFVNLVQNSIEAVRRRSATTEPPAIWIAGRTEGERAFIVVRDNGDGIEPRHLDKIFDPFFTTKDVGEGMGLGLSICYRIVQEHEGRISARSERGRFTEFTLEFPAAHPPP